MLYQTKTMTLKNNILATFRSPTKDDAAQMIDYLHTVCSETEYLIREPEEALMSIDKEENFLNNILNSESNIMIACEIEGKIAGNCNLNRYTMSKMKHRAEIGIAIRKEFWGLGIGSCMFNELISLAKELGISQLELDVCKDNTRAISLYEKFGFFKIGKKPNSLRLKNGTMLDEISMIKLL